MIWLSWLTPSTLSMQRRKTETLIRFLLSNEVKLIISYASFAITSQFSKSSCEGSKVYSCIASSYFSSNPSSQGSSSSIAFVEDERYCIKVLKFDGELIQFYHFQNLFHNMVHINSAMFVYFLQQSLDKHRCWVQAERIWSQLCQCLIRKPGRIF